MLQAARHAAFAGTALAQGDEATPTPTPTPTATPDPAAATPGEPDQTLALLIIGADILALALVYWFLNRWRRDHGSAGRRQPGGAG